ncbi:MAG: tetratricopeptide repeat protein [Coleofasciculus sp. D1-CHI-01]|uniref:tetratricopeptide repeat protein n=1 Tax=Coleofasciculus sp. D1-CHI-01 TaxID=3068482 RepID=UPI0032FFF756
MAIDIPPNLNQPDQETLDDLVTTLELSDGTTIVFAITPESAPNHPVVEQLKSVLNPDEFQVENFFYSQESLIAFLYALDKRIPVNPDAKDESKRPVIMAFGIEQLPRPRILKELKRLNLGREALFSREIVLIFWLNKRDFIDTFRGYAPDFWDWREKVVKFTTRPPLNPLLYPYLESLIAENSYLKMSGVMQVQRQVDIFLDQVYVSLKAERQQQVTERKRGGKLGFETQRFAEVGAEVRRGMEFAPSEMMTKTVTHKVDLAEAVGRCHYSVILGDPGAGKTTLLRYLALHFAMAQRDGKERVLVDGGDGGDEGNKDEFSQSLVTTPESLGNTRFPVFLRVADYAERLVKQPELSLLAFLEEFYQQWEADVGNLGDEGENVQRANITSDDSACLSDEIPPPPPFKRGELQEAEPGNLTPPFRATKAKHPLPSPLAGGNEGGREGGLGGLGQPYSHNTNITQLLCEKMRQGECLVLLDGLDEVFNQTSRQQIVKQIEAFVTDYPDNKYVITSRIAGYQDVKLGSRFTQFTITQMEFEQVERFLRRWCLAIEKAQKPDETEEVWRRDAQKEAEELLEAIQGNEGVKRLTGNPLLLTILALIHRNGSRLPNRRVELYALAVKTLIEDWQLSKNLPNAPQVMLRESEVIELLAPLAYWMHEEKPSGLITQAEAEAQLGEKLAELNDEDAEADSVKKAVQEFLRRVRETTGLFVERAPNVYGFMHLTFEEYFVARYIADNEVSEILEIIQKHQDEARWQEPILLALGYLGIHSPKRVNRLLERLFKGLEDYQPVLGEGEIQVKNNSSSETILQWSVLAEDGTISWRESDSILKELLFAGQVVAEVEVNSRIRSKVIEKLGVTYLGLDEEFDNETIKQILRLLRQIERFNQKGEVIRYLRQAVEEAQEIAERGVKALSAILYVACGESGAGLVDCVTEIVNQITNRAVETAATQTKPAYAGFQIVDSPQVRAGGLGFYSREFHSLGCVPLFCSIKDLVEELGKEMTPALEVTRQNQSGVSMGLTFITAMSYLRSDDYEKAIPLLEEITGQNNSGIQVYIDWSLAAAYQEVNKFDQAIDCYQACLEKLGQDIESIALSMFWMDLGVCYQLNKNYELAIDCFERMLTKVREADKLRDESLGLYHIGRTYQDWQKYEQAIDYYQQSLEIYEQLGKQQDVISQWYWLADCYQDWGQYEKAIECQQNCLALSQQLNDKTNVANVYYELGWLYHNWGKYKEAIAHYQQSLKLNEQLGKHQYVANQWDWLAVCYRDWGQYEKAIECEQKCLAICQQLDNPSDIALSYYKLGRIYQDWYKYEEAIAHHQQSLELYEQLDKQQNVANQWYNLADCYRDWGQYEKAIECEQKDLAIRQQLDDQPRIALAYYQLGRIYQDWGQYEDAIAHYQQSLELNEQLDKQDNVASVWYGLADCYRDWGHYEQAIECEQKDLAIRQQLDDPSDIANAYNQLGRIYQDWGKYEEAIAHHQQSLELYDQLDKQQDVANQWYWLANCYRNWGQYEKAIECEQKDLAIRQQLDDQPRIALAYYQLGRIYQDWGKYEEAIAHHQQSRELYEQLDKQKNVANQWYRLADCYRAWGQYEKAIECEQKDLAIRQQLDDQPRIALAYYQLGRIYQDWGKYEDAIAPW